MEQVQVQVTNNGIGSNLRVAESQAAKQAAQANANAAAVPSFGQVLNVQFTKHANTRLNDRKINLSEVQLERVKDGINRANEKGIRDSLVLVDDVALVVNVRSRTVITALKQGIDHVFSNIDGAVIV
ncbi:MAG: hypothetical protein FWF03_00055 [Defluviitaleaceae bacterium]|nr:hypothetical protein [Defluviitaleaceae bacterium]